MEVFNEKLNQINRKLDDLSADLKDVVRLVTEHEKWINKREGELEILDDRFKMLEEQVSDHQSYIDERKGTLREFEAMKLTVSEHHMYITTQKGAKQGIWDMVKEAGMILGLIAGLLKLYNVF